MISIRRERPEDIGSIRAVNEAAFGEHTEADIVDALRHACPDLLPLVAESDGEIVGHILSHRSQSRMDQGPRRAWGSLPWP